eukprot:2090696-Alexandrium_andersonii.AAC.1
MSAMVDPLPSDSKHSRKRWMMFTTASCARRARASHPTAAPGHLATWRRVAPSKIRRIPESGFV